MDKQKEHKRKWYLKNRKKILSDLKEKYQKEKEFRNKKKENTKEWYKENKEKSQEYHKKRFQIKKNDDDFIGKRKKYQKENKGKIKENQKEWRIKNKKKISEKNKKWNNKNTEKRKAHSLARKIKIPNQLCQICNDKKANQRHHEDYSKPLEVMFVCGSCHYDLNMGVKK